MQAHLAAGRLAEALTTYRRCRRVLRIELGIAPSDRIEDLVRHLAAG